MLSGSWSLESCFGVILKVAPSPVSLKSEIENETFWASGVSVALSWSSRAVPSSFSNRWKSLPQVSGFNAVTWSLP